jgi:hypothetical protein
MGDREGDDDVELDIAATFGAEADASAQVFSIYVPNKDRDGREIGNQRRWVLEALQLLGTVGGGATAMPPVEGVWMDAEGEFVWENPVIVYSYIKPDQFVARLSELRLFLHRMGRETKQGEVAFEFDGRFYRIRGFDEAGGDDNGEENQINRFWPEAHRRPRPSSTAYRSGRRR